MRNLIFLSASILIIGIFALHDANAITITATPQKSSFGPNDWIIVNLSIQGYTGGPITWVAHRPDNSVISGTIYNVHGGTATHEIVRDAFDNYFGTWSIDYTYNNVTETTSFRVEPIILTVITDKDLYFEPDIMKINITTSYYVPVAEKAEFYHISFYDNKGNPAKDVLQHDIRVFKKNIVYDFPISELIKYNPPGLYKLKVQYFNKVVEIPFLLGDYRTFMQINAQTDRPAYLVDEDIQLNLHFTRVTESEGILKITDPTGNTTSQKFSVDSVHTTLVLKGLTEKPGTYGFEIQYSGVNKRGSYTVNPNPRELPNIELGVFPDKLNYKPGEIIHVKIHSSEIIANSTTIWVADKNGTDHQKINYHFSTHDGIFPYKIGPSYPPGRWDLYVDYAGIIKSVPFYVQGNPLNVDEMAVANQFAIPRLVSNIGNNLDSPTGIAVDANDDLYVVSSGNAKVEKFGPDGRFLFSWGGQGSGDGEFIHPNGIAIGKRYVFVADTGNARIQMFDKNGTMVYSWGEYGDDRGMFHTPVGLALDKGENLFVADSGRNTIQIFSQSDTYANEIRPLLTYGGNFTATNGIAFGPTNNFYVSTADDKILSFSGIGNLINFYGSAGSEKGRFDSPSGIAIDSKGNFYVADTGNHRIQKFDKYGNFLLSWGSEGLFAKPVGLAIDSSDNLYVADEGSDTILKFSLYGSEKVTDPNWVKDNALLWSHGGVGKEEFAQALRYLVNQGSIKNEMLNPSHAQIPSWLKEDAMWWAREEIDTNTFAQAVQYLISTGVISL